MTHTTRLTVGLIALVAGLATTLTGCERLSALLGKGGHDKASATTPQGSQISPVVAHHDVAAAGDDQPTVVFVQDDKGKFGLVAADGSTLASREWDWIDSFTFWFTPGGIGELIPVNRGCRRDTSKWGCEGGRWGYINRAGKTIIEFQFDGAMTFKHGVAAVKVGSKMGLIDKAGRFVVNPTYDRIYTCDDGRHVAGDADKVGYIGDDGREALPRQYAFADCFDDGLANVSFEASGQGKDKTWGKTGVIDEKGQIVLNPVYDHVAPLPAQEGQRSFLVKKGDGKWAFVDAAGKNIGGSPDWDKTPLPTSNDTTRDAPRPVNRGCVRSNPKKPWVCDGGKWGYVDRLGREVIGLQFDDAEAFDGDVAAVKVGTKWGLIDRKGRFVLNPKFDSLQTCADARHVASEGGKYSYVKSDGTVFIAPQFAGARCFEGPVAIVTFETKWNGDYYEWQGHGAVDRTGRLVVNPVWTDVVVAR